MGDRARAARAGQRIREQRPAGALAERGGRARQRAEVAGDGRRALAAAQHDDAARRGGDDRREGRRGGAGVRGGGKVADPRPPVGPPAAARLVVRQRLVEHERLAQRQVQVDRARARSAGGPDRAAGERADPAQRLRRRVLDADLGEHPHGVAVELHLVDRLPRTRRPQLRRAVGGQHDQRHARLARLDHRRQVVRRRRARRAGEHRRAGRSPWRARARRTRRCARRSARSTGSRRCAPATARQGSSASPGDVHRAADAAAAELVAERAQQQVGVGRSGHDQVMGETLVLLHGFAGTGRAWDPVIAELGARTLYGARPGPARPWRAGGRAAGHLRGDHGGRARRARRRASRSAGTRWAAGSRSPSRSPRPSGSRRLVLVATTAGIEDADERAARRAADERLADADRAGGHRGVRATAGSPSPCSRGTTPRRSGAPARTSRATTRPASRPRCAARARAP